MNRENEEQRPESQTLCGALQKEPNCKCLVLSVLIYGCLAAVTWCRCANVTKVRHFLCITGFVERPNINESHCAYFLPALLKHYQLEAEIKIVLIDLRPEVNKVSRKQNLFQVVINFSRYPIRSTRHVSPCDDGYIYIPVAFMGMLYLVYLVECYHSPSRIDLLHAESQDSVLSKLLQLKSAQPTIWWKAVSYHYVRRKRQITRYRNGDNYTTTQVYYERINTHAATSFYYYDYCGVKDISKELILDPKVPITKINLSKGFAFSNMRSATEFEEARSRFFAEQELRDDYMEMREGLDLGYNPNPTTLVAVLGNPWFTNRYVYWSLSALLLSWPLRVIIEYKTQYADYQITKLFGINYDTPNGSEPIHASMSQQTISQPGSYMLAPSYSEALLMDPVPGPRPAESQEDASMTEMVPSYSEALLYQRAEQACVVNEGANGTSGSCYDLPPRECSCPCHASVENRASEETSREEDDASRQLLMETTIDVHPPPCSYAVQAETGKCGSCGKYLVEAQLENNSSRDPSLLEVTRIVRRDLANGVIPRDMSEPNLRSKPDLVESDTRFLRMNGQSLRNILEHEQEEEFSSDERIEGLSQGRLNVPVDRGKFRFSLCSLDEANSRSRAPIEVGRGAIPKRTIGRSRVITNPMSNDSCALPNSKTYFCLKSILKQNKRRYTLITAEELQNISNKEEGDETERNKVRASYHEGCTPAVASTSNEIERLELLSRSKESLDADMPRRKKLLENLPVNKADDNPAGFKRENTRTLIFASPIQEVCPGDPFGGKDVIRTRQEVDSTPTEESPGHTVLTQLGRTLACDRKGSKRRFQDLKRQRNSDSSHPSFFSCPPDRQHPYPYAFSASTDAVDSIDFDKNHASPRVYQQGSSFPPYEGSNRNRIAVDRPASTVTTEIPSKPPSRELTRSFTERRAKPVRNDANIRRSFTGRVEDYRTENNKWPNLNMETSL